MKSYKDMEIYTLSYSQAIKVHEVTLKLPQYELFEEGSQARRSSKGITSCIVEGYGRRRYKAEFIKFLIYAHASCDETKVHLEFLRDTHKNLSGEFSRLLEEYDLLGAKIGRFISYVEREWKPPVQIPSLEVVQPNPQLATCFSSVNWQLGTGNRQLATCFQFVNRQRATGNNLLCLSTNSITS